MSRSVKELWCQKVLSPKWTLKRFTRLISVHLLFILFAVPIAARSCPLLKIHVPRCSPRFLSFRHGALKPFIVAQRDILLFLEGRKLKHRTSESWSNHFVPTDRKVDSQRFPLPPVCHYLDSLWYQPIWILYWLECTPELFSESSLMSWIVDSNTSVSFS